VASLTRAKVEVADDQIEATLKTLKKVMIKGASGSKPRPARSAGAH
jgi:hypothetical protein